MGLKNQYLLIFIIFFLLGCSDPISKGEKLISEKKYYEAIEELKKVKKDDKDYAKAQEKICLAYYNLGNYYITNGNYDSALIVFGNIPDGDKLFKDAQSKLYFVKAKKEYIGGNYTLAAEYIEKVDIDDEFYEEAKSMKEEIKEKSRKIIDELFDYYSHIEKIINNPNFKIKQIIFKLRGITPSLNDFAKDNLKNSSGDIFEFYNMLRNYLNVNIDLYTEWEKNISYIHPLGHELITPSEKADRLEKQRNNLRSQLNNKKVILIEKTKW